MRWKLRWMFSDQPPRPEGSPGPEWWPRFGFKQAALWTLKGFAFPTVAYLGIWIIGLIWVGFDTGWPPEKSWFAKAGVFPMLGSFLSGGSIALTLAFTNGAKWGTLFGVIGIIAAITLQWRIADLVLLHL